MNFNKRILNLCIYIWTGTFLACSIDPGVKVNKNPGSSIDFARSEIITSGTGVADGHTELLVVIQMMNSDGTPVRLFKPTYAITQGGGVTTQECTTSNNNGVSTCILKSTQSGVKKFTVTNLRVPLEKDILFTLPGSTNLFGLSVTSGLKTSSGFSLRAALGGNQPKGQNSTASGFKLFGGPEGNAFSR